jgi:hypothetical protein
MIISTVRCRTGDEFDAESGLRAQRLRGLGTELEVNCYG